MWMYKNENFPTKLFESYQQIFKNMNCNLLSVNTVSRRQEGDYYIFYADKNAEKYTKIYHTIAKNDEKWQNSKCKFTQRMDEENVQKWTLCKWSVPTASKFLFKKMHFSVTCSWTAYCSIW